jgi:hypothetical protein
MSKKIQSFDRQNLKEISIKIEEALTKIGDEYGIILSTGGIRFSGNEFTTKINGASLNSPKTTITTATIVNPLNNIEIGKTQFMSGRMRFTVVGYMSSRPKYPFVGINSNGTRYKFTREAVLNHIVN